MVLWKSPHLIGSENYDIQIKAKKIYLNYYQWLSLGKNKNSALAKGKMNSEALTLALE